MSIIRYEPFGGAGALFDDFLNGFFARPLAAAEASNGAAVTVPMRVDVTEENDAYRVNAELPGFKKEDIRVTVDGDLLTISAENTAESEKKEGTRVLYRERRGRSYSRSFRLGNQVNLESAAAKYENGVLELTLPKTADNGVKRITVH
jgi:HSP20 family protein